MGKYKYIFFDVAGTLLHKPSFFVSFNEILKSRGFDFEIEELKFRHKLISEAYKFPDVTNEEFYKEFNSEFLYGLGIIPDKEILNSIFKGCTYLPWEPFEDTSALSELKEILPLGIISNFNFTLRDKLNDFFGPVFSDILVSEELGVAKPDPVFYEKAIQQIGKDPREILYIGDSLKLDINPANKAGMTALLIDRDKFYPKSKYRIKSLFEIKDYLK